MRPEPKASSMVKAPSSHITCDATSPAPVNSWARYSNWERAWRSVALGTTTSAFSDRQDFGRPGCAGFDRAAASASGPRMPEIEWAGGILGLVGQILEIGDPIECRTKFGALGFEGRNFRHQRVALALGDNAKRREFIAAHLEPGREVMTFAGETKTQLGQVQFMRLRLFRQLPAKLVQLFVALCRRRRERLALGNECGVKLGQGLLMCLRYLPRARRAHDPADL